MDRRDFLNLGRRESAPEATGGEWIRPPFAEAERDFLANCTRCDKCIVACEFDALFRLPDDPPRPAAGTPAMDVRKRACHMCAGWPCVAACETGALSLPEGSDGEPPATRKFALAEIDTEHCLPYRGPECGACAGFCPLEGALQWRSRGRPVIDADVCTGCGLCREACIMEPKAVAMTLNI